MDRKDYPVRSKKAKDNGTYCEKFVQYLLPGIEFIDSDVDAIYKGAPLEIKSCQMYVDAADRPGGKRLGSFLFKGSQDKKVKEGNGRYVLLVKDGNRVVCSRIVLATRLFPDFEGRKSIMWNGAISAAEAC